MRPRPGTEVEVDVESFAHGGAGVARDDGFVVFVRGAVPGDRVRARVTRSKRDYAEARVEEILKPSSERIEARAPHPGAPWQVLPYERQLAEKERQVADALTRLGGFEDPLLQPIVPAARLWNYRNKLEYSFGEDDDGALVLGFHRPASFNQIDDVEEDVLATPEIDALRLEVRDWCRAQGMSAWNRSSGDGFLRNLVVREGANTGQLQARIVTSEGDFDAEGLAAAASGADSMLWTSTGGISETTQHGETVLLRGEEWIEEKVCGLRFRISSQAFFQTNTEMAEKLYGEAVAVAGLSGKERVFDLFCGIGTISLVLARAAGEVWGIEVVEQAIGDAERNAALNAIGNARFTAGDVRTAMRPLVERAGRPEVVVVDPPRAGLSQKVVRRILETEPTRIVYVSCNPTTLAPNARQIAEAGYALRSVTPVDMFPQTPHIECVALFERSG